MAFWLNGGSIVVDGSGNPVDCAVCPCTGDVSTPCNPSPVPRDLTLVLTFLCNQISVTLTYDPTVHAGQPAWTYGSANPDIHICGELDFADFSIWCDGGTWNAQLDYKQNGFLQSATSPGGGLSSVTAVSTSPLCLTMTGPNFTFSGCGTGDFYFAIGPGCSVYPECPVWASMPSTATLTYTVGSMAQETMNLTKSGNSYIGSKSCDVGDGHNVIFQQWTIQCTGVPCLWAAVFDQFILLDGATVTSSATWGTGNHGVGTIQDPTFPVSTSPFHVHLAQNSDAGSTSGGATKVCGGKTYPFGTGISGTFDVVTP